MSINHESRRDEAYKRMRFLLEAMPLACHMWDKDYRIIDVNAESLRMFEFKDKNLFRDNFTAFSPEYQPDGQRSDVLIPMMIEKAFTTGKHVFNWMHQTLSGTPVPTEVTLVRIAEDDDYILASYVRDLREYNRMLEEIGHREDLLNAVNKAAAILLAYEDKTFEATLTKGIECVAGRVDVDRAYIWKNAVIDGVLYYTSLYEWLKESRQNGLTVHPAMKYRYDASPRWEMMFNRGECINGPISGMPPDEQKMLAGYGIKSILVIPVHLHNKLWGFVSFDDCHKERTFSKDEEDILRSASLMIVNAIIRYTMTLDIKNTDRQLKEALTAAQEANQAKSSFLATMSHEIRTPISAIIGMTRIGKTASDAERINYAFNRIDGASNHLLGVINDILDISKIESGKFELSCEEFVFNEMIETVVNVTSFCAEEKRQNFSVSVDKNIPYSLIGDDQRFSQVITNLLSNAVKFTPEEKSIHLDARLADETDGICTLRISVKDEGIGISAEQQARLFSSFQQADNSTTRKFGGSGLGLAISKHIVELMDGSIWIESEFGNGATFFFTVRVRRGSAQAAGPSLPDAGRSDDETISFQGYHLLLVEDLEINREIVMAMLETTSITIDCAENGAVAVRMFEKNPDRYDIIFMDVQMPEMDGYEATRRIRALGTAKAAEIPIIAMTANVFREDIEKCLESGMNGHMGKPFDVDEVINVLRERLGKKD